MIGNTEISIMISKIYREKSVNFVCGLAVAVFVGFLIFYSFSKQQNSNENDYGTLAKPETVGSNSVKVNFARLPLSFEANAGQADKQVKFLSRGRGYALFLSEREAIVQLRNEEKAKQSKSAILRIKLEGANRMPEVVGQNELAGKSNYFIGNNPNDWHTNIPTYSRVLYKNVYPGVDQIFYGNGRELEYDFLVAPEADSKQITLDFAGADKLNIDAATGDLVITIGGGQVIQKRPVAYQEINGERREIQASYKLSAGGESDGNPGSEIQKGKINFEIGEYDRSRALVIDPVLLYSTYLGGASDDKGFDIAVDAAGNAYVTGETTSGVPSSGAPFPTTTGAFQTAKAGGSDVFVSKINAAGNALIYSTYLGGSVFDSAYGIALDSSGNAYVTGVTTSTNFPTTPGSYQPAKSVGTFTFQSDSFITKLNANGNALVYSTYFGGGEQDERVAAIALDALGNSYITGNVNRYQPPPNFPTLNPFQPAYGGGSSDAFLTKLNASGTALVFSTYFGGAESDAATGVAVDANNDAYISGSTFSGDFPTLNAYQSFKDVSSDAFASKFNSTGSLQYSTFLGGSDVDEGNNIAVSSGSAYVIGYTRSANYDVTPNALQPAFASGAAIDAFVTKLSPAGNSLLYSTFLGGSLGNDVGLDIFLDAAGRMYLTGSTDASNYPITPDAAQTRKGGGQDAFFTVLNPAGSAIIYSTFLGGSGSNDIGRGVAVDPGGNANVVGFTNSRDFPTTPGAIRTTKLSDDFDAFVARFSTLNPTAPRNKAFDFDGDGKADISVFRPSDTVWYLLRSGSGFSAAQFGISTDKITPADFDGDGKTDISVYRDGVWYWLNSSNSSFTAVQFGLAGDIPVPADYTGDRRAELAVYRMGVWYTLNLANNQSQTVQFGISTDKPVPADFDGDGKTDFAVYRDGVWWMLRSTAGVGVIQFGIASDKPVVGDYDGDGRADQAVYRDGVWYVLGSTQGSYAAEFGIASDIPVAADYDGDGKTDLAVYRDGVWWMLRSTAGAGVVQFGVANDKPIPAAFIP